MKKKIKILEWVEYVPSKDKKKNNKRKWKKNSMQNNELIFVLLMWKQNY